MIDKTAETEADNGYLLTVADLEAWEADNGRVPDGAWVLLRTGWQSRAQDQAAFLNVGETGPRPRGPTSRPRAGSRRARKIPGFGVETVGIDAGAARGLDPPFPLHNFLLGAGRLGLTQLANLDKLPITGALLVVAPLSMRRHRQPQPRIRVRAEGVSRGLGKKLGICPSFFPNGANGTAAGARPDGRDQRRSDAATTPTAPCKAPRSIPAARVRGAASGASSSGSSGSSWAKPRKVCISRVRTRNASRSESGGAGRAPGSGSNPEQNARIAVLEPAQIPRPLPPAPADRRRGAAPEQ